MVEDYVRLSTFGEALYLCRHVLGSMVYDPVCSQFPSLLELLIISRRGDHLCTQDLGDLNCSTSDSTACSPNEHCLPCSQVCPSCQHVPRRQKDKRHRSRFFKGKLASNRQNIACWNRNIFGVSSLSLVANDLVRFTEAVPSRGTIFACTVADSRLDQDSVTRVVILDYSSNLGHFARTVAPG